LVSSRLAQLLDLPVRRHGWSWSLEFGCRFDEWSDRFGCGVVTGNLDRRFLRPIPRAGHGIDR
jgi:hypothetical protein